MTRRASPFEYRSRAVPPRPTLSLSDRQLRIVMEAAGSLQPDRRDIFLQRCAAMLQFRSRSDDDVADVVTLAKAGLSQKTADKVTA